MRWGADHAWLAASGDPEASVRRWCRRWAQWLTVGELNDLVAYTRDSNKRWSADQSAAVLGISVTHLTKLKLRHLGADDDPNYEVRLGMKRANSAERSRKHRAKNSSGAKRGRPALQLSPDEALARRRAQTAERVRRHRAVTQNPVTPLKKDIDSVTQLSVTRHLDVPVDATSSSLPVVVLEPVDQRRADPQATTRRAPAELIVLMRVDRGGDGFARAAPPPPPP